MFSFVYRGPRWACALLGGSYVRSSNITSSYSFDVQNVKIHLKFTNARMPFPKPLWIIAIYRGRVCVRTHISQTWTAMIPTSVRKNICECRLYAGMYQTVTFLNTELPRYKGKAEEAGQVLCLTFSV